MSDPFFERPVLNSPYERPKRHWELDDGGQPTGKIVEGRREADFLTPIPGPKKQKGDAPAVQEDIVFNEGSGLSTRNQQYDVSAIINEIRGHVERWRSWPNSTEWQVSPETVRLLQHWRNHRFIGYRPFFCQVEAVETAIWLTEVAPKTQVGKRVLKRLEAANNDANPGLDRCALKLATGVGNLASPSRFS